MTTATDTSDDGVQQKAFRAWCLVGLLKQAFEQGTKIEAVFLVEITDVIDECLADVHKFIADQ